MRSSAYLISIAVAGLLVAASAPLGGANPAAKRLYDDLLANYNRLIRPVQNVSEKLTVKLGLKLSQLIEVDLKNQIMTTNVWVVQKWMDYKLRWKPEDYGGVDTLYVPSQNIWLPDIVLFNNADGKYESTLMTKASLNYNGEVVWKPPAIYKSSCKINVEWFPFDEQSCDMKFGSWTYDGYQVDLKHVDQERGSNIVNIGIDLKEFYLSVEWDILSVPATRNEEYFTPADDSQAAVNRAADAAHRAATGEEPSDALEDIDELDAEHQDKLLTDITFYMTLRRKTLFYTVNLIIPCVGISFLTVLVFYLPSDSGEKVTLCISILLSLTVFFLLLAEIIPPTSLAVPLLGKYLLFTMILVTLSICVTVGVLNVHFRSPATHRMSPWVRRLFIDLMPRMLLMQRPNYMPRYTAGPPEKAPITDSSCGGDVGDDGSHRPNGYPGGDRAWSCDAGFDETASCTSRCHHHPHLQTTKNAQQQFPSPTPRHNGIACNHHNNHNNHNNHNHTTITLSTASTLQRNIKRPPSSASAAAADTLPRKPKPLSQVKAALKGVEFIAQHIKKADEKRDVIEDWKFISMVLDRFFLWIFTAACLLGTGSIILRAPSLYDMRKPIDAELTDIGKMQ